MTLQYPQIVYGPQGHQLKVASAEQAATLPAGYGMTPFAVVTMTASALPSPVARAAVTTIGLQRVINIIDPSTGQTRTFRDVVSAQASGLFTSTQLQAFQQAFSS